MAPSLLENNILSSKIPHEILKNAELIAAKKYPILNINYAISINNPTSFIMSEDNSSETQYECTLSDQLFIMITILRPWVDEDFIPVTNNDTQIDSTITYSLIPSLSHEAFTNRQSFEESGWVVLGHQKSILAIKKFPFGAWIKSSTNDNHVAALSLKLQASLPSYCVPGSVISLKLLIISDTWIGSDQEFELKFRILE